MSKKLFSLLVFSLFATQSLCMFDTSPAQSDQLDIELSELQASLLEIHRIKSKEATDSLKEGMLGSSVDFVCTGGSNPLKMTQKEYIDAFANGPCTPLVVLAGVAGTKLHIQIDCPVLRANHPDIFSTCKWTTCESSILGSKPKSEYSIWIPDLISPFSLVNPTASAKGCFSKMIGINWESTKGTLEETVVKGIKINPVGMTPDTKHNSRCGFEAISNLLPISNILSPSDLKAYDKLRAVLENKGYKIGISLQALPYDWRKSFNNNEVSRSLIDLIKKMHAITGKKVSIVAHSFGNVNTLNVLNKVSQNVKDTYIKRFFAIAPPFLGSPKTVQMLLGGDGEFSMYGLGVTFWMMKMSISKFAGIFDLMPRRTWNLYLNSPWMKSILNRIQMEKASTPKYQLSPSEDIVSSIFPDPSRVCFATEWKIRSNKCLIGMEELNIIGGVDKEILTVDNISEMFNKHSFFEMAGKLFEKESQGGYDNMQNPGVETVIIYSSMLNTPKEYHYSKSPKTSTTKEDSGFYPADKIRYTLGDETVLASSSLLPGFKWAYEYSTNQAGAKPVVFAELCSVVNQRNSVFQSATNKVDKNQYQGLNCRCKGGSENGCNHLGMISDPNLVEYIAESLKDYQTPLTKKYFDTMSEPIVDYFVKECKLLEEVKSQ